MDVELIAAGVVILLGVAVAILMLLSESEKRTIRIEDELKKLNKHEWHDLRENANDLPTDSDRLYLCVANSLVGYTYTVLHGRSVVFSKNTIVAWRELEEFEV